ncbi:hypothetical protein CONLIGDRAFT_107627 [Coniochaeta ligniaria NRRL 30616]|uniref:Uncharacterized protein n=1 Tax=Coniochaeta ligniaria NRRL 30616 TaxID=1408157 RepID=A0A1J7J4Y2_9PEZI|nr:hypothetical protein CONLIGDRAFT_107627 [Coniochaeta ligniaria NRRL 30616]
MPHSTANDLLSRTLQNIRTLHSRYSHPSPPISVSSNTLPILQTRRSAPQFPPNTSHNAIETASAKHEIRLRLAPQSLLLLYFGAMGQAGGPWWIPAIWQASGQSRVSLLNNINLAVFPITVPLPDAQHCRTSTKQQRPPRRSQRDIGARA